MARKPKTENWRSTIVEDMDAAKAAEAVIDPVADEGAEELPDDPVIARIADNPLIIVSEPETFGQLLAVMKTEVEATLAAADVSTGKGRGALISMSRKVTRTKTALEKAITDAAREIRKQTDILYERRKEVGPKLTALAAEVRKPVTDWEDEEDRRKEIVDTELNMLDAARSILMSETADRVVERIEQLRAKTFDEAVFKNLAIVAEKKRSMAIEALEDALPGLRQAEADRAELAALREAKEKRDREDAEKAAEEKRQQDKREREARQAEQARLAEENAKAQAEKAKAAEDARVKAAAEAAAAKAKAEAEAAAQREQAEKDRLAREAIDDANRRAAEAEQRERARQEQEARDAEAMRKKEAADAAAEKRRQENRAHQGRVLKAAKEALMEHAGLDETAAKAVVTAIKDGQIPAVTINF